MSESAALGNIGILFALLGVISAFGPSTMVFYGAMLFWGVGAIFAFGGLYQATREKPHP